MLRLPCGRGHLRDALANQRSQIRREVRERGANTDYKILMALPPSQLGFSDKRPASRAVPISGIGGVLPPDPYGTHEMDQRVPCPYQASRHIGCCPVAADEMQSQGGRL